MPYKNQLYNAFCTSNMSDFHLKEKNNAQFAFCMSVLKSKNFWLPRLSFNSNHSAIQTRISHSPFLLIQCYGNDQMYCFQLYHSHTISHESYDKPTIKKRINSIVICVSDLKPYMQPKVEIMLLHRIIVLLHWAHERHGI